MWAIIEPGMGITAANLATLRPLFRSILGGDSNATPPCRSLPAIVLSSRRSRELPEPAAFQSLGTPSEIDVDGNTASWEDMEIVKTSQVKLRNMDQTGEMARCSMPGR
ncbi:uncharacterized protein BP5553_07909 [Venustampulla echinocandica]|uniref:Uncharacterized protein n=1 Tax=Venustampulla echinocandica TaxID=2656787 RepID=A0A370THV9_9HELO|nr:uncharacterized protein BP5553_07909 [Venustampulla echinocandica]RDL34781.1 hypothetical protein BP5553_07909 [Venustampulla echinocandica]